MRYILNAPKVVQRILDTPEDVAIALVEMRLAHNPNVVAQRISELGETQSLTFGGSVTIIAIGDEGMAVAPTPRASTLVVDVPPAVVIEPMPIDHVVDHVVEQTKLGAALPLERAAPQPLTTSGIGKPRAK